MQIFSPFKQLMKEKHLSERKLSELAGLSRSTLRKVLHLDNKANLSSLEGLAKIFNLNISLLVHPKNHSPDSSSVAISLRIANDGFDSWKVHLMNMVDEFRATRDIRLFILPPDNSSDEKIKALIAASVNYLCDEENIQVPSWALKTKALNRPWFVANMESLKAISLIESPVSFRAKNIFVNSNFLMRA